MDNKIYDVVILGGGPAGLAAGLYAGRSRLSVLILEKGIDGGQIAVTHDIENYPGQSKVDGMTGQELVAPMTEQCKKFGCERVSDTITACDFSGPVKKFVGSKGEYLGKTVIVCTGAMTRSILVWTNTPDNIIDLADVYIRTIFVGIPFTLLYNMTSALMRALGDSKRPLYFLLVASFLNIGLDLLCIIVFRMGAFGAAFATVFSQAVAGLGSLLYILKHYGELRWSREEGQLSRTHCAKLCSMGIPMGLQCSITAIGSVVLQGAVNGLGSDIVAAQTAGGKAAQFLAVPLESIGTAMTTYASQNMGAHDLNRVNRGVNTALGIGVVYSIASFLILRVADKPLIGLFLESDQTEIMANAQSFIFWNSVFYIPLAVLIIYRYTIQGLGYSSLAMFAGVAEMVARALVGFLFVPLWGYFAACIASPVAWFFACFFLIPAYIVVYRRLKKEKLVPHANL